MASALRARFMAVMLPGLVLTSACATKPPTPEEQIAVWLAEAPRALSISVDRQLPHAGVHMHDAKIGERIGSGLGQGSVVALRLVLELCVQMPVLGCYIGAAAAPFGFALGAVVGAAAVDSVDAYHPPEAFQGAPALFALTGNEIDLPSMLAEDVATEARSAGDDLRHPAQSRVQGGAPSRADGEVKLSFERFDFIGNVGEDPSVALFLRVRAGVHTPEAEWYSWDEFAYKGSSHTFSEWGANDARLFRDEIAVAVRNIATQIVKRLGSSTSVSTVSIAAVAPSEPIDEGAGVSTSAHSLAMSAAQIGLAARGPVALAAPSEAAAESPRPAVAGLPAAGTSWTYELADRMYGRTTTSVTVAVVRADDRTVEEQLSTVSGAKRTREMRAVDARSAGFLEFPVGASEVHLEFAPYLLAARGEKASTNVIDAAGYPVASGDPGWIARAKPPIWEQVTVPAGTFRALRLEIGGRRERPPFSPTVTRRFLVRVWYAPEVQRYVRLEHKVWVPGRQNSDVVVELMKFSPPS